MKEETKRTKDGKKWYKNCDGCSRKIAQVVKTEIRHLRATRVVVTRTEGTWIVDVEKEVKAIMMKRQYIEIMNEEIDESKRRLIRAVNDV